MWRLVRRAARLIYPNHDGWPQAGSLPAVQRIVHVFAPFRPISQVFESLNFVYRSMANERIVILHEKSFFVHSIVLMRFIG